MAAQQSSVEERRNTAMENIIFSPDELEIAFRYSTMKPGPEGKPGFRTPVSVSENMRRFVSGEVPVWMPYGEFRVFGPEIIPDNVARGKVFEENPTEVKGGTDLFGINWIYDPVVRGSMVRPGAPALEDANDWKEVIPFPDVEAWDWEGSAKRNAEYLNVDVPILLTQFTGYFERLISFMDFENAALALIDEDQKDAVKDLFSALTDVYIRILDKCIDYYGISWYVFHDDWGSQRAPFFSKAVWQEMIAPYIARMTEHCHKRGVIFELHSCGHSEMMLDAISSVGIDLWRPQTMNNLKKMYDEFGDRIHIARSVALPPNATEEEQIAAAQEVLEQYSQPGKYVLVETFPYPAGGADAFFAALYEGSRKRYQQ